MKVLKLTVTLLVICAIVAGVLGAVDMLTSPTIEKRQTEKKNQAFIGVLQSDGYTDVEFDRARFAAVDGIVSADNGAGYVVTSTFSGAQGNITMVTGVDKEFKCTGISIISHSETSGLGANAASSAEVGVNFRAQFVGQDDTVALRQSGGDIDALTGATITTQAIADAVAMSIDAVKAIEGGAAA